MKEMLKTIAVRMVFNLTSMKLWSLYTFIVISTFLVLNDYIDGGSWVTGNVSVFGICLSMREFSKHSYNSQTKVQQKSSKDEYVVEKESE
jgi:hypothetical protein